MKRGLKLSAAATHDQRSFERRNTCPDEEGTETAGVAVGCFIMALVETHAPMKRGLKRMSGLSSVVM